MRVYKVGLLALLVVCAEVFASQFVSASRKSIAAISSAHSQSIHAAHVTTNILSTREYVLDSSRSKFMARAFSGGLLWFKGHDHFVAVREFTGEAQITPDSITPASLRISAKAASMVETRDVFTEPQKQIINKELREIVLLPEQYPDIIFQSTKITGAAIGNNQYDLKIIGALTLHGVTRSITIPTKVTLSGNDLRAQGEFSINRSDFKVKATSAMHGMIRVRDKIKFEFDIVGHQR
ncbi:MAG: YceI family protein [Pyrinomonadaceae bacterium]